MNAASLIELTIDGRKIAVAPGTTVFDAARMNGIAIPTLCHQQNETPVGVCRVCVVDVGARVFAASCVRPAEPGMVVTTSSERVTAARGTLLELLLADHPSPCPRQQQSGDCELETLARAAGIGASRFPRRAARPQDDSSPAIAVAHDACILCDRCIRGCGDIRGNFVLARMGKGGATDIAFDAGAPMGESTCVSCGECMVSCPTGALTNKFVVGTALGAEHGAESATTEELLALPVFHNVSGTFLELNKNAVIKRRFRKGEIVCREGDFGSTAFYILEGKVSVSISSPMAHVKTSGGERGFFSRLGSFLVGRAGDHRAEDVTRRSIPIDAPVDLDYDHPVAELGPGDLFGEMTCMNFYPRSATVRAETDCTVLEMLRNVLDTMRKNKTLRAQLDRTYRQRALEDHLRNVPLFRALDKEFLDRLRERVELCEFRPRPGDLPPGRTSRQFLSGAPGIRESFRAARRRRTRAGLSFARRLFRRNRPARRRRAHGHVHGSRSR